MNCLYSILFPFILIVSVESPTFRDEGIILVVKEYSRRNRGVDGLIVTLTGNFNYGNIMQRYALKHVLEQNCKRFDTTYIQTLRNEGTNLIFENTRSFVQKYVGGEDFDVMKLQGYRNYIVGSDQVWRDWHHGEWAKLSPYFFEFIDNNLKLNSKANRISYAASFGVEEVGVAMDANEQVRVQPLLEKFSAISVREKSGRDIVKGAWGLESVVVLDPTLLLKLSDYSQLVENSSSRNAEIGKLFYYLLDKNKGKIDFINKISSALGGKKTEFIRPSIQGTRRFESVEKWLKGFRDADFVITDSYHGMIFSVINNKDFIVISNMPRGVTRFKSFLGLFGLTHRLIEESSLKNVTLSSLSSIDWKEVNERLDILRAESLNWLLKNLK